MFMHFPPLLFYYLTTTPITGSTLLIEAATFGAYRCAGALLDLGANVGAHTLAGDTVV